MNTFLDCSIQHTPRTLNLVAHPDICSRSTVSPPTVIAENFMHFKNGGGTSFQLDPSVVKFKSSAADDRNHSWIFNHSAQDSRGKGVFQFCRAVLLRTVWCAYKERKTACLCLCSYQPVHRGIPQSGLYGVTVGC